MGNTYLSGYGKWKLENYAQALRDVEYNFTRFGETKRDPRESRADYYYRVRSGENWQKLGERFGDVATLLECIAGENYSCRKIEGVDKLLLALWLRREGIRLVEGHKIITGRGNREYRLLLSAEGNGLIATEEVGEVLSGLYGKRIVPEKNSSLFVGKMKGEYLFEEQGRFFVSVGEAGVPKSGEKISGDNRGFLEEEKGRFTMILSDGTGAGEEAGKDSGRLVDLAETYLEAGFNRRQTYGLLEGMHLGNYMENRMPTLDLCEIDLFSGECVMAKFGSAPGYIVRKNKIEKIDTNNLLLGYANEYKEEKRMLEEGDCVVLLSDGVTELAGIRTEELLQDAVSCRGKRNPAAFARAILKRATTHCKEAIPDDMTVMVAQMMSRE